MRILFLTGEYPAMQGGVGDYTRQLSQALVELGTDVHVLTHRNAGEDRERMPASPHEPVVHPALVAMGWKLWREVDSWIARLQPDAVHIQYQSAAYRLHPAVNYLPWYLRVLRTTHGARRRPMVFTTFHDVRWPYMFPKAGPLRWQAVLALALYGDASVVTNAADQAALLAARPRMAGRLFPIPIGSNIFPNPPTGFDRSLQRASWGVGPDDWLLAYFGFLNASKGGETLVAALAQLVRAGHPAHLLMAGGQVGASDPTNTAYLARVQGMIRDMGLGERVHWTGFMPPDMVSAVLLSADCATLPYRDGASLRNGSLMAALAHGLPIVTTRLPERSPETSDGRALLEESHCFPVLEDGRSARLIAPENPGQLSDAVREVMTDPDLRGRLAQGAADLAGAFGWSTIAQKHLEMYTRVENATP